MRLPAPVTSPHRPRSSMAREDSETPAGTLRTRAEQRAHDVLPRETDGAGSAGENALTAGAAGPPLSNCPASGR